jgi:hypothetical protein
MWPVIPFIIPVIRFLGIWIITIMQWPSIAAML